MYVQPLDGQLGPATLAPLEAAESALSPAQTALTAPLGNADAISRLVPPLIGNALGNPMQTAMFGPLPGLLQQLMQMLQSMMGYEGGSYGGYGGYGGYGPYSSVSVGVVLRNAFEALGDYIDVPTGKGLQTRAHHWFTQRYLRLWRQGKREYNEWLDTLGVDRSPG